MAATSNVSSAVPFTKAFIVKHEKFSARVEFLFNQTASTLTLMRVNFWKSKEVAHLNLALAGDPDVPPKDRILLYREAALLGMTWSQQFPREKNPDGFYTTTPWTAKLSLQGNSPEEAFLYWVLYDLYPKNNIEDFEHKFSERAEYQNESLKLLGTDSEKVMQVISKVQQKQDLTPEEELFVVEKFVPFQKMIGGLKDDKAKFQKYYNEFQKLKFPQELVRLAASIALQEFIPILNGMFLDQRVASYISAQERRDSTKVDEID